MCLCTPHACLVDVRRGHLILWSWSCDSCESPGGLWTEPRSSAKSTSAFYHRSLLQLDKLISSNCEWGVLSPHLNQHVLLLIFLVIAVISYAFGAVIKHHGQGTL